jgi:decaprenylphospho-beta-D-ribofuranose 2-oxidase
MTVLMSGWGRLSVPGIEVHSEDLARATQGAALCRGLGRSYGDSSLPASPDARVVATPLADRILAFDPATGVLRVEAGFSLAELYRLFLHRGFFTPVSPGTKFVTVGGMVASDVHGKNHHRKGCFGQHVRSLKMRVGERVLSCSREENADLFHATTGGMGLTGHILEVELTLERIASPWIFAESRKIAGIDEFVDQLKGAAGEWEYTVGWIDCVTRGKNMGRGTLHLGRWATPQEAPRHLPAPPFNLKVPFEAPSWLLNEHTTRIFNWLWFHKQLRPIKRGIVHPHVFFYPLDGVQHWNKLYGRRGMTQYQCVLPDSAGRQAVREFLELLTRRGGASPLCVIKDFGSQGDGLLSFPEAGITISVDLPITPRTHGLIDALNEFVLAARGRIYLTKDAFTSAEHFERMEHARLPLFRAVREKWAPGAPYRSAQSLRVLGDAQ